MEDIMEELELQSKRQELIDRIPLLDPIHSPNYDEVMEQMNTLVWEEMEDPMTSAPGASCKTASGIYHIFATDAANGLAKEQLMMHEAGHCVLQHFKDNWYKNEQAARQIKSKWPKFREHIDVEGNEEDELSDSFIHMIRNITQDLEINGKYWPDENDWEEVRQRISDASLVRFIEHANENQLTSIEKWMDEKPEEIHQFAKGVYPADFGFPNGLTWMGYLHLILTQPNEFMENLNKQVDEMQRQQAEQQQGQQGQSGQSGQGGQGGQSGQSGQSGQGSQDDGQGEGGLQDDPTSIFDHYSEDGEGEEGDKSKQGKGDKSKGNNSGNGEGDGEGEDGADKDGKGKGKDGDQDGEDQNGKGGKSKVKGDGKGKPQQGNGNGDGEKIKASIIKAGAKNGDKGNEVAQAAAQAAEDRRNAEGQQGVQVVAGGKGNEVDDSDDWSAPGDGESTNLVDATPTMRLDRSVLKFIEKNCIGKTVQRDRQDPLYNYNRGKTSGGVMRTRITTVEEYRPGNLVALIDVSGSVNIELVKALLSEVLKYKSKFGVKSRIILWDTHLVDDLPLKRSNLEAICCGGGTTIARGIRYAREKYLKSEQDKLCVISDFEDYLSDWADELAEIKGDTFAICWGGYNGGDELIRCATSKKAEIAARKMKVINVK